VPYNKIQNTSLTAFAYQITKHMGWVLGHLGWRVISQEHSEAEFGEASKAADENGRTEKETIIRSFSSLSLSYNLSCFRCFLFWVIRLRKVKQIENL